MDGWIGGEWMDEWMDKWTKGCIYGMYGMADVSMYGRKDERVDEWQ